MRSRSRVASTTCNTCPEVWELVRPLAGDDLVVQRIHLGIDVAAGCRHAEERIAPLFGHTLAREADRDA